MKHLVFIILIHFSFSSLSQNGDLVEANESINVIKVRKLNNDTVSSVFKRLDSNTVPVRKVRLKDKRIVKPKYKGFITDYMLLKGSRLYVFNKPISARQQEQFYSKKYKKFWKKIKRQKRRNKLHYFKISLTKAFIDSVNNEYHNDYQKSEIFEPYDDKLVGVTEEKIENTLEIRKNIRGFAEYVILGDTLSIPMGNPLLSNCGRSQCFLSYLTTELEKETYRDTLILKLNCPKTINYNSYRFEFDLKNTESNTVKIIENNSIVYICNYSIKGRKILIDNPPIPEFREGKINSRITRIRFKIHTTNHTYQ